MAAVNAGASAILVSNHGGRQVDPAPASLDALPGIAQAVGGQVPLLLDSGVRTGADVFLALALGASAVVIGRLAAYGLAAAGEHGVRRTIELLTAELRTLMIWQASPTSPPSPQARRSPAAGRVKPWPGQSRPTRSSAETSSSTSSSRGTTRS